MLWMNSEEDGRDPHQAGTCSPAAQGITAPSSGVRSCSVHDTSMHMRAHLHDIARHFEMLTARFTAQHLTAHWTETHNITHAVDQPTHRLPCEEQGHTCHSHTVAGAASIFFLPPHIASSVEVGSPSLQLCCCILSGKSLALHEDLCNRGMVQERMTHQLCSLYRLSTSLRLRQHDTSALPAHQQQLLKALPKHSMLH